MDHDIELRIQAYLDGELPEAETREVAKLLAQDQDATLLMGELRSTRQSLRQSQALIQLPESREFYWSKISRQIEHEEITGRPISEVKSARTEFHGWRRLFLPVGALASVACALMFMGHQLGMFQASGATEFETATADPGSFTYRDYSHGTTLVWVSYPAENKVADEGALDTLPTQ